MTWPIWVAIALSLLSGIASGVCAWQLKAFRFGLYTDLQKQLDSLSPEISEQAMRAVRDVEHSLKLMKGEWGEFESKTNSQVMRMTRLVQEAKGQHKGGVNSKGVLAGKGENPGGMTDEEWRRVQLEAM